MPPSESTKTWLRSAINQPEFKNHLAPFANSEGPVVFHHAEEASHSFFTALACTASSDKGRKRQWIIHESPRQRERLAAELDLWGITALVLPDSPLNPENDLHEIQDPETAAEWFAILETLATTDSFTILCGTDSFSQYAPSPQSLLSNRTHLKPGTDLDPTDFSETLNKHGYERQPTVTARGHYAIRGGILDLFPFQSARPLRLEFFDTELESIREFDINTQASTRKIPETDLLLTEPPAVATIADYLEKNDTLISISAEPVEKEIVADASRNSPCNRRPADFLITENSGETGSEEDFTLAAYASPLGTFDAGDFVLDELRRESFFRQLNEWQRDQWTIGIVFSTKGELQRFTELSGKDLKRDLGLTPVLGELISSFTLPATKLAVLSSSELFGRYRTPGAARRSTVEKARVMRARATLDDISEGDLVVHYEYGIGKFRGIAQEDEGEELQIEYKDGSILSVPLEQAHLIGKYIGVGGKTPDLNKLGNATWQKNRKQAEKSILDYAARLLRIQAEREHDQGHAHPPDTRWMFEFEQSFHYTETPDQKQAIIDTKHDLESPQSMDRLICGDVGFGKTEVAIRAAFKCITGGKQAALLCPTTVLAEQHWRTFRERFSDYPIRVDLLNRFRKPSEVRATIAGLADGSVDMVIGTHRLISGDVAYKNLGLAIVDEEQRFGVAHKEKFKDLFRQIDVLTLSATPIPRTLYMALMGARDMSTIDTPPPNRLPVATTVTAYDDRVIRDAIRREIKRGGQVFFLHNRVKTIEMVHKKIKELVPEARVLVGHGQMDKQDLETVMHSFVNHEADVLLATTIIETGIDIPNANTILIDRADRFGLADLYQLRGRVGRAGERAYAILLLPREMITQGDARKRIHAIKQYTALGSGFKIAMRDLEIRGAGNLLGTKQSGHIAQIGFDLYCQLLRQSVDRLKGKQDPSLQETTFKADFIVPTETQWVSKDEKAEMLPAFIPTAYLSDAKLRINAYRELAEANTPKSITALEKSWQDRHGRFPHPIKNLFTIARIKAEAASNKITSVELSAQRLMLQRNGSPILMDGSRYPRLAKTKPGEKLDEALEMLKNF
ncbi:transcription-repair coupling factor [Luteolibacter sp. AS25]|uniref:transcription-repair coupling factor n=1 Tax=Luteolibacter sp. AS25 TaxID=3135776 RepID=UPI00398A79E2